MESKAILLTLIVSLSIIFLCTNNAAVRAEQSLTLKEKWAVLDTYDHEQLADIALSHSKQKYDIIGYIKHYSDNERVQNALKLIEEEAENKNILALNTLGNSAPSYEKAAKWFEKAAKLNDAEAQLALAFFYDTGKGVDKDPQKAFQWFYKSAKNGESSAMVFLAKYYYEGLGTEKDLIKAFAWDHISFCIIHSPADIPNHQRRFLSTLTPDQLDEAKELTCEYYRKYLEKHISEDEKEELKKMYGTAKQLNKNER